jgi:hypothetical protein
VCVFGGTLVSVASFGMLQQCRWNDRGWGRRPGREGSEEPTRRNGDGAAAGRSISTQQDSIWRHVHACVLLLRNSNTVPCGQNRSTLGAWQASNCVASLARPGRFLLQANLKRKRNRLRAMKRSSPIVGEQSIRCMPVCGMNEAAPIHACLPACKKLTNDRYEYAYDGNGKGVGDGCWLCPRPAGHHEWHTITPTLREKLAASTRTREMDDNLLS